MENKKYSLDNLMNIEVNEYTAKIIILGDLEDIPFHNPRESNHYVNVINDIKTYFKGNHFIFDISNISFFNFNKLRYRMGYIIEELHGSKDIIYIKVLPPPENTKCRDLADLFCELDKFFKIDLDL